MRNTVHHDFERDGDLLFYLFSSAARPLRDDGNVIIRYVGICLDRKILEGNGSPDEQQNGGGGSTRPCYTSNSDLTVPSAIAPVSSGTLIVGTICGSPAAAAGLTGGSVITALNGRAVGSPDDLTRALSRFHPGETISVTWVSPSGQRTTSQLHLTAGPPQ